MKPCFFVPLAIKEPHCAEMKKCGQECNGCQNCGSRVTAKSVLRDYVLGEPDTSACENTIGEEKCEYGMFQVIEKPLKRLGHGGKIPCCRCNGLAGFDPFYVDDPSDRFDVLDDPVQMFNILDIDGEVERSLPVLPSNCFGMRDVRLC